jgi:hypothetical protein
MPMLPRAVGRAVRRVAEVTLMVVGAAAMVGSGRRSGRGWN